MKLLATLMGWFLVPLLAAGSLVARLFPTPRHRPENNDGESYWRDFKESYNAASRDIVTLWLRGEGHTIEEVLDSGLRRDIAKELTLNLMAGVRDGFIDPGFAHCLTYALSCAIIEERLGGSGRRTVPTPSWPCEYCVFFKGLRDTILPDPQSLDPEKRTGNKLGECERHGPVTLREVPAGACQEFTIERRRHLKLLKRTNEELQLWYLIHRRNVPPEELERVRLFRQELKREMEQELNRKRKRRATDYSFTKR